MASCTACHSENTQVYLHPRRFNIDVYKCQDCGTGFLKDFNPEFDKALYEYYKDRVHKSPQEIYDAITSSRYKDLLQSFGTRTQGRKILDVGCGQGHFVYTATKLGWQVMGIDLAEWAIEIGKKFNLNVSNHNFFSPALNNERFDVITMFELIEHVPNPGDFVKRAEQLLNPGGLLYITTPNFRCLDQLILGPDWLPFHPEHVSYFTPKSLKKLVTRKTKLKLVESRADNLSGLAIKKLLGKKPPAPTTKPQHGPRETELRQALESKVLLRWAKNLVNAFLSFFGLGNALKLTFQKRS